MTKSKEKKKKSKSTERKDDKEMDQVSVAENLRKIENLDVKIKTIGENPDQKTAPIIGYFPSGYNPLKNSNVSGEELHMDTRVKVYRSVNSRNPRNPRMQLVVGVKGSEVNFVGTNYSGEAATPHLCNYALGVLDKETRELKMIPIAANRIFRLDPKFGALELPDSEPQDEAKGEKDYLKLREYSSKKDIRRDMKREAMRQTELPGTEKDFDEKLKSIKANTEGLEAVASTANIHNIPPYNLNATSVDAAYPLEKIILNGDWDYLSDIFDLVEAGLEVSPDVYPSFVCNRIHILGDIEDKFRRRTMAGILSYITHLIKYKDRHSMDGVSSAKGHKLPSILVQRFASMFGTTENKRIPVEKLNLLISYVLVLSLFIDDFRSDPSDIAKDLRMSPTALRDHYGYIGCKFVREKQVTLATLPVPLKFETLKRKRRR